MRIYNKVIIDVVSGKTIYEDSFDYCGKVTQCKGGSTTVNYPGPSPQETELLELQIEQLKDMNADVDALRPYLLQSMGLKDVNGKFIKMSDEEYYDSLSELDQGGYDLAMAATERSLKAYAGELEISPALEKSLENRRTELVENLSRNLGSGWQGTTAGIQAMAQFDESAELIREEARSGIISGAGGMTLSSLGYMSGATQLDSSYANFPAIQTGGLFSGAGQMVGYYQGERQGQFQANVTNAQMKAQRSAGLMSGLGSLAGAGLGAYGLYRGLSG